VISLEQLMIGNTQDHSSPVITMMSELLEASLLDLDGLYRPSFLIAQPLALALSGVERRDEERGPKSKEANCSMFFLGPSFPPK
jgi:hypothetical protein